MLPPTCPLAIYCFVRRFLMPLKSHIGLESFCLHSHNAHDSSSSLYVGEVADECGQMNIFKCIYQADLCIEYKSSYIEGERVM